MMSKQTAIILILVVFLGALGALVWFYFSFNANPTVNTSQTGITDVYNPFGTNTVEDLTTPPDTNISTENEQGTTTPNKLRKISEELTSGFSSTENTKTQKTDIHYILRSNGNIYETYEDSLETKRLSATTIPKVYESVWFPDGQRLLARYLQDISGKIETLFLKINTATTTLNEFAGGVDGIYLPENITAIAINPLGDKIFYLTNSPAGSSGYISKPDGLNPKLINESPLVEWLVSWPKEDTITMTTKAAAKVPGYLYFLNSQTGVLSRILGNINGLTTKTNRDATEVLYSDSIRTAPRLYLFNIKTGESKLLPWNTLPEKCVWGNTDSKVIYCAVPKSFPAGDYPDLWYKGLTSFNDTIWMINTDTMTSTLIFDIENETGNIIDAADIQIDKKDTFLFFINKTDLTFWSLSLK